MRRNEKKWGKTRRNDDKWEEMRRINEEINKKKWEVMWRNE